MMITLCKIFNQIFYEFEINKVDDLKSIQEGASWKVCRAEDYTYFDIVLESAMLTYTLPSDIPRKKDAEEEAEDKEYVISSSYK